MDMESYRGQGIDAGAAEILALEKRNPKIAGWAHCKIPILLQLFMTSVTNNELIFARLSSSNATSVKH
jgi:hypothetical protein